MVVTGKTGRAEDDGEPYKGTFKSVKQFAQKQNLFVEGACFLVRGRLEIKVIFQLICFYEGWIFLVF